MALKAFRQFDSEKSFNVTPLIDIVFLLIIFFTLISQFIDSENFPIKVPDNISHANTPDSYNSQFTTLTVMKNDAGKIDFAVGSKKVASNDGAQMVQQLTSLIDAQLKNLSTDKRIVSLRIDKDITYDQAQYALAAIAKSSAFDIQLATLKDPQNK
jgi:biopolymer transport protein ExbD